MEGRRTDRRWFVLEDPGRHQLALPVELVGRLEAITEVLPVPGAPGGIVGLAELRGRPVTLLDPMVCGARKDPSAPASATPRSALQLAPPREHLAFVAGPDARIRPLPPEAEPDPDAVRVDAGTFERAIAELGGVRGRV